MNRIRSRTVHVKNDTVCPEDLTSRTVITVLETRNGHKRKIELVQIWDLELLLNGRRIAYGEDQVTRKLQRLLGLTPKQLFRATDRINPYVECPPRLAVDVYVTRGERSWLSSKTQ